MAAQRLRAWEENDTGKTGMWKNVVFDHKDTIRHIKAQWTFRKQPGKVKGFSVHCDRSRREWWLFDDAEQKLVACIELSPFSKIAKVETTVVNPAYQGRSIGLAFYEYLIKTLTELSSSSHLSPGASKVWAKLARAYNGVLLLHTGERVQIHGFKIHGGYVYPVVLRDGQLVSTGEIPRDNPKEREALTGFTYLVTY
jgi:hypothetical protein